MKWKWENPNEKAVKLKNYKLKSPQRGCIWAKSEGWWLMSEEKGENDGGYGKRKKLWG